MTRSLAELVQRLRAEGRLTQVAGEPAGLELTGIADDSRKVKPGNLFVAVRGLNVDGHDYVAKAVDAGAAAVVVEAPVGAVGVPQLVVDRGAASLASAAAWWFDDPSRELLTVGVTGTNGKTTTSFLAAAGLAGAGFRTGLVGTIGIRIGGEFVPNEEPNTTPGALELQRILRAMVDGGEQAVVIETSSHGLAADRVASVAYDGAIFTNLSHEHLDFHGTFEAYRAAKVSLFDRLPAKAKGDRAGLAVINLDDPNVDPFMKAARRAHATVITYGAAAMADVRLYGVRPGNPASLVQAILGGRRVDVALRLPGRYNAMNALAVLGLAHGWGLDIDAVAAALSDVAGVPGRMERVDAGQPFVVVIDYAHTSASLAAVLSELRPLAGAGRGVITLVGASGERDTGKRPLMGEAAANGSRLLIVTEDDSRGEDPNAIFEAVAAGAEAAGARRGDTLLVIADRREAIAEAFRRAEPGDVVLIAGKGHETWNVGPNGPEPWSDRETALELLATH
ncbi:MAG TPA: UDP-N-acetylmuramoyl-L-alanyl-D-glutamate--2,6-diaminopimelate ligase [Candidatus Limnocylindrales bacterium]|nr:UDP-N-acetylmuramoyl-L-alanyl-D-glutamate--2,6-diaminopimelate ligase [Candidatus Limnocylindrales bacterium]